jgi:adenylyltransferase/sulfurtransferase
MVGNQSSSQEQLPQLSREEVRRYSRHLMIPDVGLEGQRKLKAASVLLIGTGGLGSPAALYLAAAGVGRLGLVDYDAVDLSNLQRQVLHGSASVGRLKVDSARERLLDLNPSVTIETYDTLLSAENAREIASGYDILLDGSDNFPTRYLVNDLAVLTGKPFVYGSILRFEGQVSVFDARTGPCYRCLFPEPPPPGTAPSCGEGGVFGVLPGTVGSLQATEVIKLILGIGETLIGRLLIFDALEMSFRTLKLRKNPHCPLCGENPTITGLIDYEAFCGIPARDSGPSVSQWDIEPQQLAGRISDGDPFQIVDVREAVEQQVAKIPGARLIPLEQLPSRLNELDPQRETVVFCRSGTRSLRAAELLSKAGFTRVKNLRGGTNAWAAQIDASMFEY